MSEEDWNTGFAKSLGVFLNGEGIVAPDPHGEKIIDDSFYILFNSHHEPISFMLPSREWAHNWVVVLDTSEACFAEDERKYQAGQDIQVQSRSLVVLRHEP
jgi:glycogen operon protein